MRTFYCVRCGQEPRADGTFLGEKCLADPRRLHEMEAASAQPGEVRELREWLIGTYGWKGGWSSRRGSVRA